MFTPAMSASRTSAPSVIIVNAFWTHVMSPPFLNLLPFADAMTSGLDALGLPTGGACAKRDRAAPAARVAPVVVRATSRRFTSLRPSIAVSARRSGREWLLRSARDAHDKRGPSSAPVQRQSGHRLGLWRHVRRRPRIEATSASSILEGI